MPKLDAEVTLLTAPHRGAIAVIQVRGRDAIPLADAVFRARSGLPLAASPPYRAKLGRLGNGLGDEVVAVVLGSELPTVEFQCHGGMMAVSLVTEALVAAGGSLAETWTPHDGQPRLEQEAEADLAQATTVATAEILLDQSRGALRNAIRAILATLDQDQATAIDGLNDLIERGTYGVRLVRGWRVVLCGRPNVGKSRLLNAIAGYERAIVDATPGTTRDAVTVRAALGGWPVEIVDTAGVRDTRDPIERAGVARSRLEQEQADLVLLVLDRSAQLMPEDIELMATLSNKPANALLVANKADLPAAWTAHRDWHGMRMLPAVSAENGLGLGELIETIVDQLVPRPPRHGEGVPFRAEQQLALGEARQLLRTGQPAETRRVLESLLS